jgi:hypothetical protein
MVAASLEQGACIGGLVVDELLAKSVFEALTIALLSLIARHSVQHSV